LEAGVAATGNVGNGMSASTQAPMVNWNVVNNDWQSLEANVRMTADNIERTIKQSLADLSAALSLSAFEHFWWSSFLRRERGQPVRLVMLAAGLPA
jgi:hypothetical protein